MVLHFVHSCLINLFINSFELIFECFMSPLFLSFLFHSNLFTDFRMFCFVLFLSFCKIEIFYCLNILCLIEHNCFHSNFSLIFECLVFDLISFCERDFRRIFRRWRKNDEHLKNRYNNVCTLLKLILFFS